jgi:hypothetical protein
MLQSPASTRARQMRGSGSGALRLALLVTAYAALGSTQCTFPQYDLNRDGLSGAGNGGSGAEGGSVIPSSGTGGTSAMGGTAGTEGGTRADPVGGGGGEGGTPPDPECAPEQWPVDKCADTCLHRFPDHCYDGDQSGDESDVDCGGSCQGCTYERCEMNDDCLSGSCRAAGPDPAVCAPPLGLDYIAHEGNASVSTTAWSLTLTNEQADGGSTYNFRDLKLRYYFQRDGVTEPLALLSPQTILKLAAGDSREISATRTIVREESTVDGVYDAYVEIGFTESGQLFPGDQVLLYQQLRSGDPARSNFDQRTHYSFDKNGGPSLHITVFYKDRLAWGLQPQPNHPRACFARAVDLNGQTTTVNGQTWETSSDAKVTTTGTGVSPSSVDLNPPASSSLAKVLGNWTHLQAGQNLTLPVENDAYLVYLYAVSPSTADNSASHFTLQGEEPDSSGGFMGNIDDGQAWVRLGPYRVTVTDQRLVVGVSSGAVNFAGLELWYPE